MNVFNPGDSVIWNVNDTDIQAIIDSYAGSYDGEHYYFIIREGSKTGVPASQLILERKNNVLDIIEGIFKSIFKDLT
jgi:hypothetical protein